MGKLQEKLSGIGESINPTIASEFRRDGAIPVWSNYYATSKFKSVKRAIRRGNLDLYSGMVYPSRPFNNRKPTKGRKFNELKRSIYEQLTYR